MEDVSYRAPCDGDSGSGQWVIANGDTENERRALVGVHSHNLPDEIDLNGRLVSAVCGSSLAISTGDQLLTGPTTTLTYHETKLKFIKECAQI